MNSLRFALNQRRQIIPFKNGFRVLNVETDTFLRDIRLTQSNADINVSLLFGEVIGVSRTMLLVWSDAPNCVEADKKQNPRVIQMKSEVTELRATPPYLFVRTGNRVYIFHHPEEELVLALNIDDDRLIDREGALVVFTS